MTKNYVRRDPCLRKHTFIWLSFTVQICKMIISPGTFLIFSVFWFSGSIGDKRTIQNDKNFCLSGSISQEPHIIWLPFMVYMCKVIISLGRFWFWGSLGVQRTKNGPKWQKESVCLTLYLRNRTSYDCDFWYTYVKWWSHHFSKFWFFGLSDG